MLYNLSAEQMSENNIIRAALQYMENNISDPALSNSVLAAKANISEVYFRKLFVSQYGISPKQYILDVRIEKAKELLSDGAKKITSISEECGFSSIYHFSRSFKEKTGFTPTEYMNNNHITVI